jgi:hypothetical protein
LISDYVRVMSIDTRGFAGLASEEFLDGLMPEKGLEPPRGVNPGRF